jgi:hypothetical protein
VLIISVGNMGSGAVERGRRTARFAVVSGSTTAAEYPRMHSLIADPM